MTDRPSYIPPVLDPRRVGDHRRPTPPTLRPTAADPHHAAVAEFEKMIRQEGEGYARLVNVAGAMGVKP